MCMPAQRSQYYQPYLNVRLHVTYSILRIPHSIHYTVHSTHDTVSSKWYTVHGIQCITYDVSVYTPTEQSSTLLASHTSQKGLNEDTALGLQLAVEVSEHGPDNPQHNFEVC